MYVSVCPIEKSNFFRIQISNVKSVYLQGFEYIKHLKPTSVLNFPEHVKLTLLGTAKDCLALLSSLLAQKDNKPLTPFTIIQNNLRSVFNLQTIDYSPETAIEFCSKFVNEDRDHRENFVNFLQRILKRSRIVGGLNNLETAELAEKLFDSIKLMIDCDAKSENANYDIYSDLKYDLCRGLELMIDESEAGEGLEQEDWKDIKRLQRTRIEKYQNFLGFSKKHHLQRKF